MRTAVSETSLEAFHSFGISSLQSKEREVLKVFYRLGGCHTREQLAKILGWKESAVCGRVNSLVTKGVLEESGVIKTSSGRSAKLVRLPVIGQRSLF